MTNSERARLAEIKARHEAATPGEWRALEGFVFRAKFGATTRGTLATAKDNNAEFIAHARQDIPWLLDMVERQERVIDCNSDDSDHEISLLKAESAAFRRIAMEVVSAAHVLWCECPEGTRSRLLIGNIINTGREKILASMRRDQAAPNAEGE